MNVFAVLGIVFLLSFMVESLVEYIFGTLFNKVPVLQPHSWALMYVAGAVGVLGAWIYQLDLVYLLSNFLDAGIPLHPFGIVVTGLTIGRGSNAVHDLIMRFFRKDLVTNARPS